MNIKGQTAIITGATGKLASQIVLAMAGAGANCICIYNNNTLKAKKLEQEIKGISENVIARSPLGTTKQSLLSLKKRDCFASLAVTGSVFIKADLTNEENIEKVFAQIEKLDSTHSTWFDYAHHGRSGRAGLPRFAPPRILINAASIFEKKPIGNLTFEYIRQTFDINFTASVIITQKFVELVQRNVKSKTKPLAKVINITDITALRPPAGFSIYCASKAALLSATKSHAKELAPDFTVNAVSPGIISWSKGVTAAMKKKMLSLVPAGRAGSPEEVADAVKFLIENDYLTGQIINIDGGKTI